MHTRSFSSFLRWLLLCSRTTGSLMLAPEQSRKEAVPGTLYRSLGIRITMEEKWYSFVIRPWKFKVHMSTKTIAQQNTQYLQFKEERFILTHIISP